MSDLTTLGPEWQAFVATHGTKNVTLQLFSAFLDAFKAQRHDARAKIAALEQRIADLEARRSLKYVGVYEPGQAYAQQEAVSYSNSLWVAQRDTTQPPGTPQSGWALALKRPRDGKDLR